jgi:hypothetical protein
MYNSLYENKMRERFSRSEKVYETNEKGKTKKRSEGKFVIRVRNLE